MSSKIDIELKAQSIDEDPVIKVISCNIHTSCYAEVILETPVPIFWVGDYFFWSWRSSAAHHFEADTEQEAIQLALKTISIINRWEQRRATDLFTINP